jgi:hypothetical protein
MSNLTSKKDKPYCQTGSAEPIRIEAALDFFSQDVFHLIPSSQVASGQLLASAVLLLDLVAWWAPEQIWMTWRSKNSSPYLDSNKPLPSLRHFFRFPNRRMILWTSYRNISPIA